MSDQSEEQKEGSPSKSWWSQVDDAELEPEWSRPLDSNFLARWTFFSGVFGVLGTIPAIFLVAVLFRFHFIGGMGATIEGFDSELFFMVPLGIGLIFMRFPLLPILLFGFGMILGRSAMLINHRFKRTDHVRIALIVVFLMDLGLAILAALPPPIRYF
jgi:hypothetical protein